MKPIVLLAYMAAFVVAGVGYLDNIFQLTECDFEPPYKCEVIRSVGVFVPPVGIIVGYVSIDD